MADGGVVVDSRFDIFGRRPQQISVRETRVSQHAPNGTIGNQQLEFTISGTGEGWIDLSRSYFSINVGLAQELPAGIAWPTQPDAKYIPIPQDNRGATVETFFPHLLWDDVRLYFNGVDVSDETNQHYGLQAFYRDALTKGGSWARAGAISVATYGPALGAGYAIGQTLSIGDLSRAGRVELAAGGGASEGLILTSCTLNKDLPASMQTDENYCDFATDFARGAKRRGVAYKGPISSYHIDGAEGAPVAGWEFRPKLGMWEQGAVLPPQTDLRIVLKRGQDAVAIHRDVPNFLPSGNIGAPYTAISDPAITDSLMRVTVDFAANLAKFKMRTDPRIVLNLLRIYPTETMREALATGILTRPAVYNIVRSRVQPITIPRGVVNVDAVGLFSGVRPEVVVVAIPPTRAVTVGSTYLSPFRTSSSVSKNAGWGLRGLLSAATPTTPVTEGRTSPVVNEMWISWGGRVIPQRPFRMDTDEARIRTYYEGYMMNSARGERGRGDGPMISYEDWLANYTFFVYNTNPDGSAPGELAPALSDVGSMELHIRFDSQRPSLLENTIITMGFSGAAVEIDARRNVNRIGW